MNNEEMLKFIEDSFEENYELLRLEGGHSLPPHVKKLALQNISHHILCAMLLRRICEKMV